MITQLITTTTTHPHPYHTHSHTNMMLCQHMQVAGNGNALSARHATSIERKPLSLAFSPSTAATANNAATITTKPRGRGERRGTALRAGARQVTAEELEKEMTDWDLPLILDVFAVWCSPCVMLKPEMEKVGGWGQARGGQVASFLCTKYGGDIFRAVPTRNYLLSVVLAVEPREVVVNVARSTLAQNSALVSWGLCPQRGHLSQGGYLCLIGLRPDTCARNGCLVSALAVRGLGETLEL